eukprot:scaffold9154_cov152-Isochrysis_galbana.AAC.1
MREQTQREAVVTRYFFVSVARTTRAPTRRDTPGTHYRHYRGGAAHAACGRGRVLGALPPSSPSKGPLCARLARSVLLPACPHSPW